MLAKEWKRPVENFKMSKERIPATSYKLGKTAVKTVPARPQANVPPESNPGNHRGAILPIPYRIPDRNPSLPVNDSRRSSLGCSWPRRYYFVVSWSGKAGPDHSRTVEGCSLIGSFHRLVHFSLTLAMPSHLGFFTLLLLLAFLFSFPVSSSLYREASHLLGTPCLLVILIAA